MNFLWKKGAKSSPLGQNLGRKIKNSWAARSAVFRENSKWWRKIHTRLTWVLRVKKVIQQFYWLITVFGFTWGQSYLATLVTPENCTNVLRNLTFVVQFEYFSIRPKRLLFFRATFAQLSLQKATFDSFLSNFLRNYRSRLLKSIDPSTNFQLLTWTS